MTPNCQVASYLFDDGIEPIDGLVGLKNPPPVSPLK